MPETNLFLSIGRGRNLGWTPPPPPKGLSSGYGTGTVDGSIADPYNNILTALRLGYRLIGTL